MFGNRYFGPRFFGDRFFGEGGTAEPPPSDDGLLTVLHRDNPDRRVRAIARPQPRGPVSRPPIRRR